jgi:hypothetical protein
LICTIFVPYRSGELQEPKLKYCVGLLAVKTEILALIAFLLFEEALQSSGRILRSGIGRSRPPAVVVFPVWFQTNENGKRSLIRTLLNEGGL